MLFSRAILRTNGERGPAAFATWVAVAAATGAGRQSRWGGARVLELGGGQGLLEQVLSRVRRRVPRHRHFSHHCVNAYSGPLHQDFTRCVSHGRRDLGIYFVSGDFKQRLAAPTRSPGCFSHLVKVP
jgi:hypothetical protein